MRAACPQCRLRFEREAGYFIGAIYINYGVTVVMALSGFFLLEQFTSLTLTEQLVLWTTFAALFPFAFYRYAKELVADARLPDRSARAPASSPAPRTLNRRRGRKDAARLNCRRGTGSEAP